MKISLLLVESIYNCEVIIKTPTETQKHFFSLEKENIIKESRQIVIIDICNKPLSKTGKRFVLFKIQ